MRFMASGFCRMRWTAAFKLIVTGCNDANEQDGDAAADTIEAFHIM